MLNLVHLKVLAAVLPTRLGDRSGQRVALLATVGGHHLSRLEAATGAKLVQRIGRGIRLTPEGQLLASRAAEILGRVDAAANELAARVGLQTGRVRLAANASTLSTIVPKAAATLAEAHPGLELSLIDRHPVEALQALRCGEIDVALVFRYADARSRKKDSASSTSVTTRSISSADDPTTASPTIATPPGSAAANGASTS